MPALSWLLNLGFAGSAVVEEPASSICLTASFSNTQSLSASFDNTESLTATWESCD